MAESGTGESLAARCESRLRRLPWSVFVIALVAVSFLKSGVNVIRSAPDPLASFPTPQEGASALSYGSRTLARILGWEFINAYIVITAVVALLFILLLAVSLRPSRAGLDGRLILTFVLLGPIGAVLLNYVGGHDAWVLLGGVMLGLLGERVWWALGGAIVMVLGNPEQAVLATLCLLVLTWTPWLRSRRSGAVAAAAISMAAFLGLALYAHSVGVESRVGYLVGFLGNSVYNFGANAPLALYSTLGVGWIVLFWLMVRSTSGVRVLLLIAALLVPLLVMALTVDQTRVFVGVSTASVVALLSVAIPKMRSEAQERGNSNVLFWTCAAGVFLPSVVITFTGTAIVPHSWFFTGVVPALKPLFAG